VLDLIKTSSDLLNTAQITNVPVKHGIASKEKIMQRTTLNQQEICKKSANKIWYASKFFCQITWSHQQSK
jgi:hypothetical protein